MKKLPSLSIFFPAFNDSKILPYLIEKSQQTAPRVAQKFEIIIVNDGSTDETIDILQSLQKKYPQLRVINHKSNQGYGAALISGFKNSRYEWIFYTDGDGQYDPLELKKLFDLVNEKTDVVNGFQLKRSDNLMRTYCGKFYNFVIHKIYSIPISEVDCDFRLIRKSKLSINALTSTSGLICLEIVLNLAQNGARFRQTRIHHYPRPYGTSKFFNFRNILKTFEDHVKFYWTNKHQIEESKSLL